MSSAEEIERAADREIDACEERIASLENRVLDRQAERDTIKSAARALLDALPECHCDRVDEEDGGHYVGCFANPTCAGAEIKALEALL